MKKMYEKPFAKKVAFSYEDQVVAASGDYQGGEKNKDNTQKCQFQVDACNRFWTPAAASVAMFSLTDCDENP